MWHRHLLRLAPCLFALLALRCGTSEFDVRISGVTPLSKSAVSPRTTTNSDVVEADGSSLPDEVSVTIENFMEFPTLELRIEQYRVDYRRLDVESVEGITTPHNIANVPILAVVPAKNSTSIDVEIVKANEKQQPPLAALRSGGDRIEVVAEITFFGRVLGRSAVVSLTTRHLITFADFPD
ncbi:MAG: hypothetical protein HYT87_03625 [Nitrospirae bacterium]|nr:hypothetical protein [Nitrospirota bacterium]